MLSYTETGAAVGVDCLVGAPKCRMLRDSFQQSLELVLVQQGIFWFSLPYPIALSSLSTNPRCDFLTDELKLWFVRECGAVAMLGLSLMSTGMIRELYSIVPLIWFLRNSHSPQHGREGEACPFQAQPISG